MKLRKLVPQQLNVPFQNKRKCKIHDMLNKVAEIDCTERVSFWTSSSKVIHYLRKLLTIKVEVHIDKNHLFQFCESFSIKGRDVEKVLVIPGTKKAVQQNSGEKLKKIINSTCVRKKKIKPTCSVVHLCSIAWRLPSAFCPPDPVVK